MAADSHGEHEPADLAALVTAVDHVGVATGDLDATVAFYTGVLGLREVHREVNEDQQVTEAMLAAGGTTDGAQLQVLAPGGPSGPIASFLDRRGPGLQHLAVRVRDIDRASDLLRGKGVRLLYDAARPGTRGSRINFLHPKDAGGVLVELVEPAAPYPRLGDDEPGGSSPWPAVAPDQQRDES
jgi:methylmalonyl-CoA/ethylmalonyl-CoA epimerase